MNKKTNNIRQISILHLMGNAKVKTNWITRGSQEPVIAHLVFNLTSKVDRKWRCYT